MAIIREATETDVHQLVQVGSHFFSEMGYSRTVPFDELSCATGIHRLMDAGAMIFVADVDGEVVGTIIGLMSSLWCQPHVPTAVEMAWWVMPKYRGPIGIRLLRKFEEWGKAQGAKFLVMSDIALDGKSGVADMLGRMNYQTVERTHMKVI
jgi:hypothetical protein